jgi:hypothetical protein
MGPIIQSPELLSIGWFLVNGTLLSRFSRTEKNYSSNAWLALPLLLPMFLGL